MNLSDYRALAAKAIGEDDSAKASQVASKGLNAYPDNPDLLAMLGQAYLDANNYYEASMALERAASIDPKYPALMAALAKSYAEIGCHDDAYYDKAIEAALKATQNGAKDPAGFGTLSYVELMRCNFDKAFEYAQEGLKRSSDSKACMFNMSIAMLANHMWEEGWFCYDQSLKPRYAKGTPDYGLPMWDGSPGKVIVSGEQGLGDEIMFASMIPDIQKDAEIILDTEKRLCTLFARSFGCEAWGTKGEKAPWKLHNDATHWIPMGSLGTYYRKTGDEFPGTPYLVADPERRIQWRALLDALGDRPKIGIAWSGGIPQTGQSFRSMSIPELQPILDYDVDWISLQYKNTHEVPHYMHHWKRAAEGDTFEDTAALIVELDLVVSVQTTVVHCAGALGKETLCLLANRPQWRYGAFGDRMPWYDSVKLLRQHKDGTWPLEEVSKRLEEMGAKRISRKNWDLPLVLGEDDVAMAMAG